MDTEKKFVAAITKVRKDYFFLEKWIEYYGEQCGRENLYIFLDGFDWQPPEELLRGVNYRQVRRPKDVDRKESDILTNDLLNRNANRLLQQYRFVIRTDIDEFVVVDPKANMSLKEAMLEHEEIGHAYSIGVDVLQKPSLEQTLDRTKPIIGQRNFGLLNHGYCKPFFISRPARWTSGAHQLRSREPNFDPKFILFHFALADQYLLEEMWAERFDGTLPDSFAERLEMRYEFISKFDASEPLVFEDARDMALRDYPRFKRHKGQTKLKNAVNKNPNIRYGHYSAIDERFQGLI